jgi:hypothetical protein
MFALAHISAHLVCERARARARACLYVCVFVFVWVYLDRGQLDVFGKLIGIRLQVREAVNVQQVALRRLPVLLQSDLTVFHEPSIKPLDRC